MDRSFVAQLNNYRITTAEILYWMPDHRHVYSPMSGRT